ncbi:uncharacterized protein BDZ99DRAFT_482719 [Mytilinidion resinicola]|uniref:F-box domain-containing protein n=1 Tax=Mytilinidion resinicola TaxID=574789 RepID=A0A6A6Y243_9PEZI|nr:uncharacterized protein BDZ99DRAFT_482719 [Mytilinidion resinicola]KAF2802583.1 hypothetical protein BDZ99DRAFT_482719 [Mytilinidion resinicola]
MFSRGFVLLHPQMPHRTFPASLSSTSSSYPLCPNMEEILPRLLDQMALDGPKTGINAPAPEILHIIFDFLDLCEVKSLRLTNKALSELADRASFDVIFKWHIAWTKAQELGLFPTIDGTKPEQEIKQRNPKLYQNAIEGLAVHLRQHPAETWATWYSKVVKASVGYNRSDIVPATPAVYRAYGQYCEFHRWQQDLWNGSGAWRMISRVIKSLPALQSIELSRGDFKTLHQIYTNGLRALRFETGEYQLLLLLMLSRRFFGTLDECTDDIMRATANLTHLHINFTPAVWHNVNGNPQLDFQGAGWVTSSNSWRSGHLTAFLGNLKKPEDLTLRNHHVRPISQRHVTWMSLGEMFGAISPAEPEGLEAQLHHYHRGRSCRVLRKGLYEHEAGSSPPARFRVYNSSRLRAVKRLRDYLTRRVDCPVTRDTYRHWELDD